MATAVITKRKKRENGPSNFCGNEKLFLKSEEVNFSRVRNKKMAMIRI
jgi:hypothetical protein